MSQKPEFFCCMYLAIMIMISTKGYSIYKQKILDDCHMTAICQVHQHAHEGTAE